ncbi:potassium channel family protein [uncultured Pseudodesulfovibrio sp.]|uniref:potassium channel family protein n=1 Tax=uncultured Pseudodesulfovibrio sp. TaxID=2035858 RepID=UPI0029C91BAB|nr:potassium channel family protein [uncultured Pseudodesulfovibrio sp.]
MKYDIKPKFWQVVFTHFVPSFFLGVVSLLLMASILPGHFFNAMTDQVFEPIDVTLALSNGLLVAAIILAFHAHRNHRITKGKSLFRRTQPKEIFIYGAIVGFCGGSFEVLFGMINEGVVLLTLLVFAILIWHFKAFAKDVVRILKPGNHATWGEVAELMRIYMTMIAGFTLLNATLEVGHLLIGTPPPFGFGANEGQFFINSLYFTVVTMTTLGFGDIVPQTWDGKLLLIIQTFAGYIMFALMVGIITRGVNRTQDEIENQ